MQLPGWDSLESVTSIQNWLNLAGIFFLALLVVSELLAHSYGNRKDTLAAQAAAATENAQRAEVAALQERLANAARQQAPRRLTRDQTLALVAALSRFHGQQIEITCVMGDGEAHQFAEDLVQVFRAARWTGADGVNQAAYTRDPVGVLVELNPASAEQDRLPSEAAAVLLEAFVELGILPKRIRYLNPQVAAGTVALVIGHKPALGQ